MSEQAVCPYYGCDEELCDVGCGYISPHDAKMIIKFCSAQFCECHKYRELADRLGERLPAAASTATTSWAAPVHAGAQPVAVPAFGLFCFGVTAALFALKQLPVSLEIHQLSLVIMAGALGQIITGLGALRTNQLRAVAFTAFGLFWLSLLAVELLPSAGYGQSPGPLPQAGYFTMWGMFSLILAQGGDRLARTCRVVFSLSTVFLLLLALAHFTGSTTVQHAAALVGFTCSLPGLFCGVRQAWREGLRLLAPARSQVQTQRAR